MRGWMRAIEKHRYYSYVRAIVLIFGKIQNDSMYVVVWYLQYIRIIGWRKKGDYVTSLKDVIHQQEQLILKTF